MFIPKKDRKQKVVQDYQYINKFTVKNSYLLPLINDLVDNMGTRRCLLRWICGGDITTSGLKKETNRRQHLQYMWDHLNQWSCSLA